MSGERLAGEFVDQRLQHAGAGVNEAGEIAGAFCGGGNDGGLRFALPIALAFVVDEKEILVVADRAAEGCAELVLVQRFGGGGEKISGIERVVAKKVIDVAVKCVACRIS